ncbi:Piso0_000953 [Millerozyma farinosa CBS 7064]|uniref:Piso0_000953 protein n=1 Tax=Pichia sorbitophila (strain ATCC MYA-4447 / BCRC 22081 / CBS 7064 / NBRC 10061 / NRRL Y-12695) TaxID=559304 RepID=G8YQI3_PICSO|nr:Piso0_000953 [Millerozyma farinosa CBS 7064]
MSVFQKSKSFVNDIIHSSIDGKSSRPIIVAVSGPQGSGKSFLTEKLAESIQQDNPQINVLQFSIDDFYLTHAEQQNLNKEAKESMGDNKLLQGRGLPGTHDLKSLVDAFSTLCEGSDVFSKLRLPTYDKGAFEGQGERNDVSKWRAVDKKPDIILFEGWFNGYRSMDAQQLRLRYLAADNETSVMKRHTLYHLEYINDRLKAYEQIWSYFDYFIGLRTDEIRNVYQWRLEQEHTLKKPRPYKTGMSDEEVKAFVDRYMPVYEMYYEGFCDSVCVNAECHNLKLTIDKNRTLLKTILV